MVQQPVAQLLSQSRARQLCGRPVAAKRGRGHEKLRPLHPIRRVIQTMLTGLFLTSEEVSERYRGEVSPGTLRNWRAMRIGPSFLKVGKAVLYPVAELEAWDRRNLVICRAPIILRGNELAAPG